MRSLGYMLDPRDRWVNTRIRMVAPNPALLEDCDPKQLAAFHDPEIWEPDSVQPEPPPIDAGVRAALEGIPMSWDGYLDAWLLIDEVWMRPAQLEALGPSGVRACMARFQDLRGQWQSQAQLVVMGMIGMVVWVISGWRFGTELYVGGMVGIAAVTWFCRPQRIPPDVWSGLSPNLLDERVEDGVRLLGEGWENLARELGAVPLDDTMIHFRTLWRTIRVATFRRLFTPEGLEAVLSALTPLEPEEED